MQCLAASDTLTVGQQTSGVPEPRVHFGCARRLRAFWEDNSLCEAWFEHNGTNGTADPEPDAGANGRIATSAAAIVAARCSRSSASASPAHKFDWAHQARRRRRHGIERFKFVHHCPESAAGGPDA